mgnify:CR=1 FL=1
MRAAGAWKDRPALLFQDSQWTFSSLLEDAAAIASRLREFGVATGNRVGVISPNHPRQVLAYYAIMLCGAIVVPINHRLQSEEIVNQVKYSKTGFLFHDANIELPSSLPETIHTCELTEFKSGSGVEKTTVESHSRFTSEQICAIFFTSGTTGRPKAVPLTYKNFVTSATGSALHLGTTAEDLWLACLPLDHIGGFSILMRSLFSGFAVNLHKSFHPHRVVQDIRELKVTSISLVPTMLRRLIEAGLSGPQKLKFILLGGGPVPDTLINKSINLNLPVCPTYGLTEACSQVTTVPPGEIQSKQGTAGKPLPMVSVEIRGEEGKSLGAGKTGAIYIKGPTVIQGYLDDSGQMTENYHNEWLPTGDYGYLDQDGYLYPESRRNDLIVTGGENVNPVEVEIAFHEIAGVKDICVFGLPHEEWGEIITAAVVLSDEFSLQQLHKIRLHGLAGFKHPKQFFRVQTIPKTSLGKPKRNQLRKQFS